MILRTLFISIFFLLCYTATGFAQDKLLSAENLEKEKTYKTIEEALLKAKKTYKLDLSFQEPQLTELPKEIFKLENLQVLDLQGNKIKELPAEIKNLKNLQILNLYDNRLTTIPSEACTLNNLTEINLQKNRIYTLPKEIGLYEKLETLNLKNNRIETIPDELFDIKNLNELNLAENMQLSILPVSIANASALIELNLSKCSITELPAEIGTLAKLKTLNLYKNQLKTIPAEIGKLNELTDLNIGLNKPLSSLPDEIAQLKDNLKDLSLEDSALSKTESKKMKISSLLPNTDIEF